MATELAVRSAISAKFNAGTNPSGGMKVVGISLGKVTNDANADKALSVVNALALCVAVPLLRVERTKVTLIEA